MMRQAVLVFVLALAVRAAYVYHAFRAEWDGVELERAAASLATTGTLSNVYSDDSGPSAHVSPLYPCFLAGIYRLFGTRTGETCLAQVVVATIASSASMAFLPLLAIGLALPLWVGTFAGLILALMPLNLWVETSGAWEQPYSALLVLGLVAVFVRLQDTLWQSRMAIFLLSLLLGVAAVLSPTVLFAGMLPIALALLTERGRRRRILATATCAFLAVVLFLAPWVCRNYAVLDAFIPLRSNFGLELHIGNNDHSNGRTHSHGRMDPRSAINQLHPYNNKQQLEHLKRVGEVQYMHEKGHLAKQWIVDHPCQFLSLCATRLRLFWLPPPDLWDQKSQWNGFKSCVFSGIALLTLIVFVQFFVHRYPYRWILVAILVGYSAIYMVTHVDPRYRYPIFALTTLLAVHAIATIAKNVRIVASKYVRAVS